jgi:hypothetical protein
VLEGPPCNVVAKPEVKPTVARSRGCRKQRRHIRVERFTRVRVNGAISVSCSAHCHSSSRFDECHRAPPRKPRAAPPRCAVSIARGSRAVCAATIRRARQLTAVRSYLLAGRQRSSGPSGPVSARAGARPRARCRRRAGMSTRTTVLATARATVGWVASRRRRENIVRTNARPDPSDTSERAFNTADFAACRRI